MRFLFVIARFGGVVGGTERQAATLAGELARRGHGVTVLTHAAPGSPAGERVGEVELLRFAPPVGGRGATLAFGLQVARHAWRRGRDYDVFQAFLASGPALFPLPAARRHGRPALLKLGASGRHGDVGTSRATLAGRLKLALLLRGYDRFLCPNEEIRRELLAHGVAGDRLVLLPNGVDTALYCPPGAAERETLRGSLGWEGREMVLFAGRLEPQKNLGVLVEAWRAVVAARPAALLVLAGEGRLLEELRGRVSAAGLDASVRFAGRQDGDGVRRMLQAADAFVLPSLNEGLSNALLEAMACGLPPVASDIPGNREPVAPLGEDLLFDRRSPELLARALAALLGDAGARRRAGKAARRLVIERYGIGAIGARYLQLVEDAARASGAPGIREAEPGRAIARKRAR